MMIPNVNMRHAPRDIINELLMDGRRHVCDKYILWSRLWSHGDTVLWSRCKNTALVK